MVDDAELVELARSGDPGALEALLRRHHDRVLGICRRLAGNEADALDAAQEALIAIVKGLPRFDGRAAFSTWAYRVATNACLDELRRRGRRPQVGLPVDVDGNPRAEGSPSPGVELVADRLAVDAALARLPEDYRAAVVLRDLCDLEYAEIAEALGIPAGTVRSRIARGRTLLAALLDDGNPGAPRRRPSQGTGATP